MMKTGKNKRLLASILAASMLLAMSPFALADENTQDTTDPGQPAEQTCAAKIGETEYSTVADALAAANIYDANSDVTIVMLHDVTENIEINRSLTLDLGGHTLSGDGKKTVVSISGKDKDMDVTVKNGTVTGGHATNGGGFDIQRGNIKIENCIIEKNTAKSAGGGVNIGGSANVTITGSEIRNNTAIGSSGGAIYLASGWAYDGYYNCACEIVDTKLNNNSAKTGGALGMGASMYLYQDMHITASFTMSGKSEISSNTATTSLGAYGGGGVYLVGNGSRFIMNDGFITNNVAENSCGGAIFSQNWRGITLNGGSITGNSAKMHGGAIYIANVNLRDNPLEDEVLNIATGVTITDNHCDGNGGGIAALKGVTVKIAKNSALYNNTAKTIGDDVYSDSGNQLNLPEATEMSGDLILTSDETPITDWYYDGFKDASTRHRWGEKYSELDIDATKANGALTYKTGIYYEIFKPVENFQDTIALKAAHAQLFTLTYNVTGDLPAGYTAPTAQSMLVGSKYTVAAVPASVSGSKDGVNGTFSFNGWKKDDGTVLTGEQKLTADLTLHGVWTFTKKSSGGGTDPIEWNVSRSKTATALDTSTWTSNVTLSLPSAEEALASDVVFVLDKSTSAEKEEQALGMLTALKEQTAKTGAKVKVGVVIFNKQANVTAPLTDLATDSGYKTIEAAIKQGFSSGTNTHAGLLAGKQLLDEDTEVAANRKYLIFVSDGITYMYNAEPTVTAWSFKADEWLCRAEPDNWKSKYDNNNPPDDWSEWMNEIGKKVAAQGTAYEYPYGGKATNCTPKDNYKNYANSIDKALYLTYQVYQEAKTMGYNCYAVANESSTDFHWGPAFMRYLANGQTVDFDKIQNDILYAVSAGSTVEDQMGDAFDFVPGSLKLTVGGTELKSKANGNMTYFGDDVENLSENNCRFKVLYAPDTDAFVWTINENVSNFAPVQLTYTVKLTKPETAPGTYGTEDLKGEKNVPADKALFTNKRAVLNAINSAGAQLKPLDFPKPSVSYTVKKSSSGGGGGGGGRRPTVTIPDDVPTGLNGDDHYAYIVGYPNGNVEPNGNITRAEVATIFFRLLTEKVRTANSTQSNSLSDVSRGQWFNHAISTLSSMGIVKGNPDGTFDPDAPITRAEFAAIAARFDDKNTDTSSKFTDIASHWAKNEIGIAANKGWINGYPDGTFRPNQYITRAEAMTLVNRVLNRLPENSSDLLDSMIKWPDNSDASQWFYLAVQEATNSHYYKTKENKFEKWTKLRETRDWTELEK